MVLAKEAGLCYAAIALATDYDCWRDHDRVCVGDVLAMFRKNVEKVKSILIEAVEVISKEDWADTLEDLQVI